MTDRELRGSIDSPATDYLKASALRLVRLCRKWFHVDGDGESIHVAATIKADDVGSFFREYAAAIRPIGLGALKALPQPDELTLRTFLWMPPIPDAVLNELVRLALYSDQVIVVDPFSHHVGSRPAAPAPEGPLIKPEQWIRSLANEALLVCALEPWIRADIVILVPEPRNFIWPHPDFVQIAFHAMRDGIMRDPGPEAFQEALEALAMSANDDEELEGLVDMAVHDDVDPEAHGAVLAGLKDYRSRHPRRHARPLSEQGDLVQMGSGQNVFEAMWIADRIGGLVAVAEPSDKRMFRAVAQEDRPTDEGLLNAFKSTKLPVLNAVTLDTALALRQSGHIAAFRVFLRDVWAEASRPNAGPASDEATRRFNDRLLAESAALDAEWRQIYRDLGVNGSVAFFGAGGVAQVTQMGLVPALAVGAGWLYRNWSTSIRAFRRRPAAILLELEDEVNQNPIRKSISRLERSA